MRRLLVMAGLLSVVAIGCGGSGDDVIAQADSLCKSAQEDQLSLLDGTSANSKNPLVMKEYLASSFSQTKDLNDRLRDLTPPSDQKEEWDKWIASLKVQEQAEEKLIGTVKAGMDSSKNSAYIAALNEAIAHQVTRNKLAADLGLETCGQNPSI